MPVRRPLAVAPRATSLLLSVALVACGGGDGGGPDAGPPAAIAAVGTLPATAVNTIVSPSPSVKVTDDAGRAVPGASVTFAIVGGGGLAQGGLQTTNAQGIATIGAWRLGTIAGNGNTLAATVGTLTTTIAVQAVAGPAAISARVATVPQSQNVAPSTAVAIRPAVLVTDEFGNPVPGIAVQFAPGANSGTITGGVQATNAQGIATVGSWTVGSAVGTQTLSATAGALAPVTFLANVGGLANDCPEATAYALLATINGALATTDCAPGDDFFYDRYLVTSASAFDHEFRMASTTFDTYLMVTTPDRKYIAEADDADQTTTNTALRLIAPAGSYLVLATSFETNETGAYTLSSVGTPHTQGCVDTRWFVPGASWSESIVAATDCVISASDGGNAGGDVYFVALQPGASATITMRSTALNAQLRVSDGNAVTVNNDGAGGTDARLTVTAPAGSAPTLYAVLATSQVGGGTGAYTIETTAGTSLAAVRAPAMGGFLDRQAPRAKGARGAIGALRARLLAPVDR
jgi:hypothetical protein